VVGVDDPHCREICTELLLAGAHRVLVVSGGRRVGGGVYAEDGLLCDAIEGVGKPMIELVEARALPGAHNAQNAAAAYAATRALGIGRDVIADSILDFPGLAHRQERIAVIHCVTYVNDSKATNGDAAARALASYHTVYWIAGGRPKEEGLAGVEPWLGRVRHAFLIGEAEAAFADALHGKVPVTRCGTLARAVEAARAQAEAERERGAVVLLSPACASFDQFPNFEARGQAFRALVEAIVR
jgi:UDP-N-acetylmuramoylalanine--D-glutamate ligase